jgi:O-acetyl-ADP-ribose deacetylase (regulator of RNase III)
VPIEVVDGDLLDQPVDAIVNPWNRNTIPWWLLLPQGVSGAIKRRAGLAPFREVAKQGRLKLGQAVATGAGRLPFRLIIHVAGINDLWRASEASIRASVRNALAVAEEMNVASLAFPLIGSGSGSFSPAQAERILLDELRRLDPKIPVRVVRFAPSKAPEP